MAEWYLKSTTGNDANSGQTSWANAKATLAGVLAAGGFAAGDTIYVSQSHSESTGATTTYTFSATLNATPTKLICANDSASPPTSATTGASISVGSGYGLTINGSVYVYGISISSGAGSNNAAMTLGNSEGLQTYESCTLAMPNTGTGSRLALGTTVAGTESSIIFKNTNLKFGNASHGINYRLCRVIWDGGGLTSDSSAITGLVKSVQDFTDLKMSRLDLSYAASTLTLIPTSAQSQGDVSISNCKMPGSWSGSIFAGSPSNPRLRGAMYTFDSGSANYRMLIETISGSVRTETTLVKTGGASDGTTPISWKMDTNANANDFAATLISDDIAVWNDTTGSSKTITVDILHDSATALTDAEVWLEVDYLGNASYPIASQLSDRRTTILSTAASQDSSTAAWTTTGMSNPNTQKLSVTFTPQMKGFVYARVCLAKPSYTIYVDPKAVVS